jgi:NarL family two-component system response regulator LiaR
MPLPDIRVLVVDDHEVVRRGVVTLLELEEGIEVVAEAGDGMQAVEMASRVKPDIVLLDLEMPRRNGVEAIPQILAATPQSKILVLTSFATDDKVFPAIKAGALGYLLKDSSPEELVAAIRDVSRGESRLHPQIARKVLDELAEPAEGPKTSDPLTAREVDVIRLMALGLGNQEIADELVIEESTVRNHVSSILGKLHLANRTQAALYALRRGLASLDESESTPD